MKFTIAIEAGTDKTAYGVAVPDLPGCFSAGDTVEEAFDNAREAIEAYCETLSEDDKPVPRARPLGEWQSDPEYAGWTWGIVEVPVEKFFGPAEKINITVPARVLRRIDNYATKHGETRSGFLVRVAEQEISFEGREDLKALQVADDNSAVTSRSTKRSGKDVHVVPNPSGGAWRSARSGKIVSTHTTQREAVEHARKVVSGHHTPPLSGRDGTFRERAPQRKEPRPARAKHR